MPRLIPLPDTSAPLGAPRLWINPEHIPSATAIVEDMGVERRLSVELKLQGLNLSRHWLASGTLEDVQAAWRDFLALIDGAAAD